jgi:hypothetical protein
MKQYPTLTIALIGVVRRFFERDKRYASAAR